MNSGISKQYTWMHGWATKPAISPDSTDFRQISETKKLVD